MKSKSLKLVTSRKKCLQLCRRNLRLRRLLVGAKRATFYTLVRFCVLSIYLVGGAVKNLHENLTIYSSLVKIEEETVNSRSPNIG
jgi:hypothetical protein